MIKIIKNSILTIILLVSTTGFTISKHYCGNEQVSIRLNTEAESCCNTMDCCHTEFQFTKLSVEFLTSGYEEPDEGASSNDEFNNCQTNVSDFYGDLINADVSPKKGIQLLRTISQSFLQNFRL